MRKLLLQTERFSRGFKVIIALVFLISFVRVSYGQNCPTLRKVSGGECTNTGAGSKVFVVIGLGNYRIAL